MIRIIIADDHQMFIDGIKSLLENQKEISIIGEAADGDALLKLLAKKKTDIILMDINMPGMNGLDATRIMRKQYPEIKILVVTMYNTKEFISRLLAAGASGYILKNAGKNELIKAIQTLYKGEAFFSDAVTKRAMEGMQGKRTSAYDTPVELTDREKEVLKLIAQEFTSQEIANKLFLSLNTIETHRKNILSKLDVKNTAGLTKYALQNGLLDEQ